MKIIISFQFIILLNCLFSSTARTQNGSGLIVYDSLVQLNHSEHQKINKRWESLKPQAQLVLKNGDTLRGQLFSTSMEHLTILQGNSIFLDSLSDMVLTVVPYNEIAVIHNYQGGIRNSVAVMGSVAGGSVLGLTGLALGGGWTFLGALVGVPIGAGLGYYLGKKLDNRIKNKTFQSDSLTGSFAQHIPMINKKSMFGLGSKLPSDQNKNLFDSKQVKRIFPDKHLRISTALSLGPNLHQETLEKVYASADLASIRGYRYNPMAIETFDLSYRHRDKFIFGAQLYLDQNSTYIFSEYTWNNEHNNYFNYDIGSVEGRVYAEYAVRPMTRFFTKRLEVLAGLGIGYLESFARLNYEYIPDTLTGEPERHMRDFVHNSIGFQIRSACHYYLMPGFSLFAGVEGIYYRNLIFTEQVFPTEDANANVVIPGYTLNFSTVRLKLGAAIYF